MQVVELSTNSCLKHELFPVSIYHFENTHSQKRTTFKVKKKNAQT